jgi:hypothetical protein
MVWGVTIPAAIFNNACAKSAYMISDPALSQTLRSGNAYALATKSFIANIQSEVVRGEMIEMFAQTLRTVWLFGIPFAGIGLLMSFVEREVKLRTTLRTEFGLARENKPEMGRE